MLPADARPRRVIAWLAASCDAATPQHPPVSPQRRPLRGGQAGLSPPTRPAPAQDRARTIAVAQARRQPDGFPAPDETRHLQGWLARRPVGRRLARPAQRPLRHRHRHPAATGAGRLELPVAAVARPVRQPQPGQGPACLCLRAAPVHGAAAAGLPVGRGVGLPESHGAGAPGTGRNAARAPARRALGLPGWQRRLPRRR